MALLLEVQSVVLPKFGFQGSQLGVMHMMKAMEPHNSDPEFAIKGMEINALIGQGPPPPKEATMVEVQLDINMPMLKVPITAPPGTNIYWLKCCLCQQDPTGTSKPE